MTAKGTNRRSDTVTELDTQPPATAKIPAEVAAALATLEAAGIDSPEKFGQLISDPEPKPDPYEPDPPEVAYAKHAVLADLSLLADQALIEIGTDPGQVDVVAWASELIDRLIAHGLIVPTDWAGREKGDALHDTNPPKEN